MTTIILYGNANDEVLRKMILNSFSRFFHIIWLNQNEIKNYGKGKELLLIETSHIESVHLENGIFILKENADPRTIKDLSKDIITIVHSENREHVTFLSNFQSPAISCGMFEKDTFTFSSISQEDAIVSLQRPIMALTKNKVEPCEMPVDFSGPCNEYALLVFCALKKLLHVNFDEENGIKLSLNF